MNRALPAVLVTLLVTSLLAIPVVSSGPTAAPVASQEPAPSLQYLEADQQTPVEIEGTTNRLSLTGEITAGQVTYGPDLGLALATTDDHLTVDNAQYALVDREFETTPVDERDDLVRAAYNDIGDRSDALKEREVAAVEAHADGDISDRELLQTLLRNQNEAMALHDALERLTDERTDQIPGYGLSHQQTRADKTVLDLHRSPIRASLMQAAQSGDQSVDVAVATAVDDDGDAIGYSLSMIEGDTYVRETVRFDNRRPSTVGDQFADRTYSETIDHASDRYPWAGEQGWSSFSDSGAENLYKLSMEVDQNQLEIYLDGGTGEVYREHQELALEGLPTEDVWTATEDGLDVAVTTTSGNGPTQIAVTDADTDGVDPVVGASISIDGVAAGETGTDGALWVHPTDAEEITVETDDATVTVPIE